MAIDEKYGLYIGNLSPKTTRDDLSDKFMRWGSSFSSQIVEDKITGRPRGFAFVYYQDERALEDALMHTIGTKLHGRVLNIKRAHRNTGKGDSAMVIEGNFVAIYVEKAILQETVLVLTVEVMVGAAKTVHTATVVGNLAISPENVIHQMLQNVTVMTKSCIPHMERQQHEQRHN